MPNPLVYMIRADITEDYVEPHHEWYARQHAPDLMAAGFWSARGYDSPVSPILWNVYEVPDVAIFSSDAYNGGHKADPFLETAVKKLSGRTVSLYTQLHSVDGTGSRQQRMTTLRGPLLASLRFDTPAEPAAIERWFAERVVPAHRGVNGMRTVRLWEQREQHPKWPTTEPRWSIGVEWTSEDAIAAAQGRGLLERAAADIGATRIKVDVVKKRYSLLREEAFED